MPGLSDSGPERFPPTRHSLVAALGATDPAVRTPAFEILIASYWKPVYKYLRIARRLGREDAEDLTQDFFANAFDRDTLSRFDPAKAKFRTYLRVCLDHFAVSAHRAATRQKRGGGATVVSIDAAGIEADVVRDLDARALDPEDYFRREWIRGLFERALAETTAQCEATGKTQQLAVFRAADIDPLGDADRPSYVELAARFAIPVTQVTNYLAWVRRVFRRAVLEQIRAVAASEAEYAAEVRDVLGIEE